ncbi:MacB family efflux pump subunit [Telmatospirillum sp.]|uniref:MacB family efflux pump subunit n=1 Tax=Telmatospirillum sp. TaxID=2079197 RepID=UPI00283D9329|nr:MacB family efflux pump subunit [Telmatospirillum sp.]MDR3436786.1 MacB family efflux pump subunit [Telmatospirillum sp.]
MADINQPSPQQDAAALPPIGAPISAEVEAPLIALEGVTRAFPSGDGVVVVLHGITLSIATGEMVAIIGASGSGKSTLMNILGCLDRATSGQYRIGGRETGTLDPDELAELRREHFGFIFQRYHLLSELTSLGNVEVPAIYSGVAPVGRQSRATMLLTRLGMADRLQFPPGKLSGGQQQRVSIARALMNDANVILADEPTGALDHASGEEVLTILTELNREGRTIILVTHDMAVASRANRIIEISDGRIISDRSVEHPSEATASAVPASTKGALTGPRGRLQAWRAGFDRFGEAFKMAELSMRAHGLRTFLTMLGIIIGIASVVAVVALGEGSRLKVLANISSLGTNTLEIFPGKDFGDMRSGKVRTLVLADATEIARQPYAAGVTPTVNVSTTIRSGSQELSVQVTGVGADYFTVRGAKLASGRLFTQDSVRQISQEVVIDDNTRTALFPDPKANPVGQTLLIGKVPATIVGVLQKQLGGFGNNTSLSVYLPYTTVQARYTGSDTLRSIVLLVTDDTDTKLAEQAATTFLLARHGVQDFFMSNNDDIRQTITSTTDTLTLLIAAIAVISLVVGGIGVMNIMLVSVSERVKEIGVRMAVGARRSDILQQFLTEAVVVCLVGGVLGILLALAAGEAFKLAGSSFAFVYSMTSIVGAFAVSSLIGVAFGYLPARSAAQLDPVVALARE